MTDKEWENPLFFYDPAPKWGRLVRKGATLSHYAFPGTFTGYERERGNVPVNPRALERVRQAANDLAEAEAMEIRQLEYVREDIGWVLRVTVDCAGGVSVADCERLHRPLSRRLDELNLIPGSYYLEVCSPGAKDVKGVPDLSAPRTSAEEEARS